MANANSWKEASAVNQISTHTYGAEFPSDFCIGSGKDEVSLKSMIYY
jgi:hypothetical protein